MAEDRNKVGSVVSSCILTDQIRLEWFIGSILQVSAVDFSASTLVRQALWRDATYRLGLRGGCLGRLRRARVASLPCTPALLRATDGDESTRRRASSFLAASGRGCYALSVRSTTPNWPRTTRRRSHDLPSLFSLSLFPIKPTRLASLDTRSKSQLEIFARVSYFSSIQHLRAFEDRDNFVKS